MEAIYYHVSTSGVALKIFPSWDHLEDFSFPQTFHSRQSCKMCTIYHLQFDHLIICVSQHQLYSSSHSCNAAPVCAAAAWGGQEWWRSPRNSLHNDCPASQGADKQDNESHGCWQITCGFLASSTSLQAHQRSAVLKPDKNTLTKCNNVNRKARS